VLKPQDATLRTIKADLYDISFLGAGVCAPEKIELGVHVKFTLMIKIYNEPLIGEGRITYAFEIKKDDARVFRMGINFINIDNKKIQQFLALIQHDIIAKSKNKR